MIRKNLTFVFQNEAGAEPELLEIVVPIDFELIEKLERAFNANADAIAAVVLRDQSKVRYSTLARALAETVAGRIDKPAAWVRDYVMAADPVEIGAYCVAFVTACLYLRRNIEASDFDKLAAGAVEGAKKSISARCSAPGPLSPISTA